MSLSRAMIFDLDGTLVDSLDDIFNALNAALQALERPVAPRENVRQWVGDGLPMLCRRAWPEADEHALARLVETATMHYESHCLEHTLPYGKILKMLELLKFAKIPMSVLSNKPHDLTVRVVRGLAMEDFFVEVRGYVCEEQKKPAPNSALALAAQMAVEPAAVCMVGDSVADVRTARNAGMRSAAVTWGFQQRSALEAEGPDHLVDDPMEIFYLAAGK